MQDILLAFKAGIQASFHYFRVVLFFYFGALILALLGALPLRAALQAQAGNSVMLTDLIKGFDYTFLNDFLQNYGAAVAPMINQPLWMLGLFFLLLIFLTSGLVTLLVLQTKSYDRSIFWTGSATYFWRMLRLTIFFLILQGILLGLFALLYWKVTKGWSTDVLDNEAILTGAFRWIIPLYIAVAAIVWMWQDYAKIYLVKKDSRWIWPAIGGSASFIRKNFSKTYLLYALNLGLLALLLLVNYGVGSITEVDGNTTIWLTFIWGQFIVLTRFLLQVINLGSATAFSQNTPLHNG